MTTRNDTGLQGYCGFEVGQHVVCVAEEQFGDCVPITKPILPKVGKVYEVRRVHIGSLTSTAPGFVGLLLKEIPDQIITYRLDGFTRQGKAYFEAKNFRPLPKLRVEDFLAASTPKDVVSA